MHKLASRKKHRSFEMKIVRKPSILLPVEEVEYMKWATIACDQFCARPEYWAELSEYVGDHPSTYKITFPEIFLEGLSKKDLAAKVKQVQSTMDEYLDRNLFKSIDNVILVEREVEEGKKRLGLMVEIDLESYDWKRVSVPIRATEDTLMERLPVRIDIRSKAKLETPHAIVVIDDPEKSIVEPIYERRHELKPMYDFDLNMWGGNIKGYEVDNSDEVIGKIHALLDPEVQKAKYGSDEKILMVVGDGNHSIATAKVHWDNLKKKLSKKDREDHPARYMLVELVNLYDEGMIFHPIHRIVYDPDKKYEKELLKVLRGHGEMKIYLDGKEEIRKCSKFPSYAITQVQRYIDMMAKKGSKVKVEYVHNERHLKDAMAAHDGKCIGLLMPEFPKEELVKYVLKVGNLQKKAFSIGEPETKRYYLEARKIVK